MKINSLLFPVSIISFSLPKTTAYYVPANGDDWSLLKPDRGILEGNFESVPFSFGIVVNPYLVSEKGDLLEPPISTIERSMTTSFVTSVVTAAPKPTKTKDIIMQINDGQVQKVRTEDEESQEGGKRKQGGKEFRERERGREKEREEEEINGGKLLKRDELSEVANGEDIQEEIETVEEIYEEIDGEPRLIDRQRKKHSGRRGGNKKRPQEGSEQVPLPNGPEDEFQSPVYSVACYTNSTLRMTLQNSILKDSDNRIGSIVSGHQFQFDGPTPQHGAVYCAGWSITKDGQLALGNSTKFYQCASGNFYNLYDEPIGYQCHPVTLDVVELIECQDD
ncbi:uncharacterized protein J8A68_004117 [[Candida] subhashii]|uniref:Cell wall mannoprotein PIR1-like C-terminal domain-containing protein n=1 Tax=[Candida] subhashii TaxID=561895 RepID=A0A8J5QBS7_9ASCO|nr:uncharacterized protein J8A68_004117 [[Candida] subhashii]KAG7662346.1 hypothetical protein J8A68_004117 [[Candida] subhashii]